MAEGTQGRGPALQTRSRLLDAAEQLFATEGFGAVTTRAILRAAGQRNESALHYHFGGRQGLLEALHERRMDQLAGQRGDALAKLLDREAEFTIQDLARIQVECIASLAGSDAGFRAYLQGMADLVCSAEGEFEALLERFDRPPELEARRRLLARHANLSFKLLRQRFNLSRRFILMAMVQWLRHHGHFRGQAAKAYLADLPGVLEAMILAPEPGP
jgi:AcrR family transcriptional regulator